MLELTGTNIWLEGWFQTESWCGQVDNDIWVDFVTVIWHELWVKYRADGKICRTASISESMLVYTSLAFDFQVLLFFREKFWTRNYLGKLFSMAHTELNGYYDHFQLRFGSPQSSFELWFYTDGYTHIPVKLQAYSQTSMTALTMPVGLSQAWRLLCCSNSQTWKIQLLLNTWKTQSQRNKAVVGLLLSVLLLEVKEKTRRDMVLFL